MQQSDIGECTQNGVGVRLTEDCRDGFVEYLVGTFGVLGIDEGSQKCRMGTERGMCLLHHLLEQAVEISAVFGVDKAFL